MPDTFVVIVVYSDFSRMKAFVSIEIGHLASLVWAQLILGRFRDAQFPDSSQISAFCLFIQPNSKPFSIILIVGYIAADIRYASWAYNLRARL